MPVTVSIWEQWEKLFQNHQVCSLNPFISRNFLKKPPHLSLHKIPFKQTEKSCAKWAHFLNAGETGKHWDFLAKFPSLSRAYSYTPSGLMSGSGGQKEDNEDCRKINDGGIVTLLMVGS